MCRREKPPVSRNWSLRHPHPLAGRVNVQCWGGACPGCIGAQPWGVGRTAAASGVGRARGNGPLEAWTVSPLPCRRPMASKLHTFPRAVLVQAGPSQLGHCPQTQEGHVGTLLCFQRSGTSGGHLPHWPKGARDSNSPFPPPEPLPISDSTWLLGKGYSWVRTTAVARGALR